MNSTPVGVCAACGTLNELVVRYCGNCGTSLASRSPRRSLFLTAGVVLLLAGFAVAYVQFRTDGSTTSTFVELLSVIPDNENARRSVRLGDYERYRMLIAARATPPATPGEATAFLSGWSFDGTKARRRDIGAAAISTPLFSGPDSQYAQSYAQQWESLGFGIERIDASAAAGLRSTIGRDGWWLGVPAQYQAVRGKFDAVAVSEQLAHCSKYPVSGFGRDQKCPEEPSQRAASGVRYFSWGDDQQTSGTKRLKPPLFDPVGRGGQVAVTDTWLMRTLQSQQIEQMLQAMRGGSSLADNRDFRETARVLESIGAYAVVLTALTHGPALAEAMQGSGEASGAVKAAWRAQPKAVLDPYTVLGGGVAFDGDQNIGLIAVTHANEAAARANLPRVLDAIRGSMWGDKPLSQRFDFSNARVVGRTILLEVRPTGSTPLVVETTLPTRAGLFQLINSLDTPAFFEPLLIHK